MRSLLLLVLATTTALAFLFSHALLLLLTDFESFLDIYIVRFIFSSCTTIPAFVLGQLKSSCPYLPREQTAKQREHTLTGIPLRR